VSLSLERDPWHVLAAEQQLAAAGPAADAEDAVAAAVAAAAAAAGPALFVEQELVVEPEPTEEELGGSGADVQR
jgi:hypothetical protein